MTADRSEYKFDATEEYLDFALRSHRLGAWSLNLEDHTARRTLLHDQIFGYPALLPSWTFEMFLDHVVPEDRPAVLQRFQAAMAAQRNWSFGCRIKRADGVIRHILAEGTHKKDSQGKTVEIQGLVQDITERKIAEEVQQQMAALVESADDAILTKGLDGIIRSWNPGAVRLLGYSADEIIGQPITRLLPEDRQAEEAMILQKLKVGEHVSHFETFRRRRDGSLVEVSLTISPIRDGTGRVVGASKIMRDISQRRRAEEQFRLVVEAAPSAMIMADEDRRMTLVNRNAEVLFGYSRAEMLGQPLELLVPPRFRDRHSELVAMFQAAPRARATGAGRELYGLRKDGKEVPIEIGLNPIETPLGLFTLASIVDITERKHAEDELRRKNAELEAVNKELDDFVYTASHDLRSPLNGVSTLVQWILQDDVALSTESRDRMLMVQGRIERMKRLLNDVRNYARGGQGAEPEGSQLTAAALVADVVATSHIPAGFSIHCDPSLGEVLVKRAPLEQVFHNLIGNAIKHHDRKRGIVRVSVEANGPGLRFSVIDDGPGIPEAYREAVFEMFKTLKPRDEVEGSGMGLAIVRKIVGRLGGQCGIDGAPGRGVNVWFEWPAVQACVEGSG